MAHEWVMDVLTDLQSFAKSNDLNELAEHLQEAGLIAAAEINSQADGVIQDHYVDAAANRACSSRGGCVHRA